ncbi:MAG: LytR/AlgR family response regulator transcription factor [Ruminococcus callidus]
MTVEYFQEWRTLLVLFSQHAHVDAVFMDICFQGSTQNGIDYAGKAGKIQQPDKVYLRHRASEDYLQQIFLSSHVKPYGYLPKPFQKDDVLNYVRKLQADTSDSSEVFAFKPVGGQAVYLSLPDVLYFSSDRRYVTAHTARGDYTGYYRLSDLVKQLPHCFYQCYKTLSSI